MRLQLMRIVTICFVVFALAACAVNTPSNTLSIVKMKETFELEKTRKDVALQKVSEFILDVNMREAKSKFEINYLPDQSELIDELVVSLKNQGVPQQRFVLNATDKDMTKAVKVVAVYLKVRNSDCGYLSFHNAQSYRFGCALEHNRNISLVNPIESGD